MAFVVPFAPSRRMVFAICGGFFVIILLITLGNSYEPYKAVEWEPSVSHKENHSGIPANVPEVSRPNGLPNSQYLKVLEEDRRCRAFPDPGNVLFVIKTGATEAYQKLPTHLFTTLNCAQNFVIFSDLEQDVGPYHLYDALDNVTPEIRETSPDFELYWKQKAYNETGQSIGALKGWSGWTLDKYKFLHIMEKTWNMKPDFDFYFFIETDTYVVWSNFINWIRTLDPNEELYLGSPTWLSNTIFAHGGSGYLLSKASMKKLTGDEPGIGRKYDSWMKGTCCGDYVLAAALLAKNITLNAVWPMINGEKPTTLPYGPTHWCQPIITMHHVTPEEVSSIYLYEQQNENFTRPLLIEDTYNIALRDLLQQSRDDWWNLSDDVRYRPPESPDDFRVKPQNDMSKVEKEAYRSSEACENACKEDRECFQWNYHDLTCGLSRSFRLGERRNPDAQGHWSSGWMLDRIQQFQEKNSPCTEPEWVTPHS